MKKCLLVLCLLLPSAAFGQNFAVSTSPVIDGTGHPVAGAMVTVCAGSLSLPPSGTVCSPTTTIFSNFAGAAQANPFTTDGFGNWTFFAPSGNYLVSISGGPLIAYSFYVSVGGNGVISGGVNGNLLKATGSNTAGDSGIAANNVPTLSGNNTLTGNNTLNGTGTFRNFLQLAGGTCSVESLQTAITAVVSGTVDARACTTISDSITNTTGSIVIPANVTVLPGPSTWPCTITTANTPCWKLIGVNSKLIGAGMGDPTYMDFGADPPNGAAAGVTNLICSSCGATTDMVRVAIPSAQRTSQSASVISGVEVGGLWINMGNSGRNAFYASSPHFGYFHDLAGYNFPGNGLDIEGDVPGSVLGAQGYHYTVERVLFQAPHSNTTGASCIQDNSAGEITWVTYRSFRCAGNITNGGGQWGFLVKGGTSNVALSTHQSTMGPGYIGETIDEPNSGGLIFVAPGNAQSFTGGGIVTDWTIQSVLIEKLFTGTQGTCMGGQSSIGTASGTGLSGNTFVSVGCSANWATLLDRANLGYHTETGGDTGNGSHSLSVWGGFPSFNGVYDSTSDIVLELLSGSSGVPSCMQLSDSATYNTALCSDASGDFQYWTGRFPNTAGTLEFQVTPSGTATASQMIANRGSACTNGEIGLSAGWQSTGTATATAVAGTGQTCSWTITTGTTTAANPTITDTLTNPLPSATTVCWVTLHNGTAATTIYADQTTLSATAPIFTVTGTPSAGGATYKLIRTCGP